MSIINTMLRDLDQRNARSGVGAIAGDGIRATRPALRARMGPHSKPALAGLALVAAVVAAWWIPQRFAGASISVAAHAARPPVPATPGVSAAQPPASGLAAAPVARVQDMPVAVGASKAEAKASAASASARSTTSSAEGADAPAAAARGNSKTVVSTAMLSSARSSAVAATPEMPAAARRVEGSSPSPSVAIAKTYSPAQMSAKLVGEAVVSESQGRQDEARTLLQRALAADPLDAIAREMLVRLHVDAGRFGEARSLLEEGRRLLPEHASFALSLARMQAEGGDAGGAMRLLDSVRTTAGDDPQYHAVLAALLLYDKRYEEAVQHYLVALRADPGNTKWLVGIGVAWENTGRPSYALEAYRRAEKAPALQPEVASFIAERLARLGIVEEALGSEVLSSTHESRP